MFDRNKLAHAVVWPKNGKAKIGLVCPDGEMVGEIPVTEAVMGSELARMIPDGFAASPVNCTLVSMAGKLMVATRRDFESAVVIERPEVTFEERLARMERRDMYRERALAVEREARARLEQQIEEAKANGVQVVQGETEENQVLASEAENTADQLEKVNDGADAG